MNKMPLHAAAYWRYKILSSMRMNHYLVMFAMLLALALPGISGCTEQTAAEQEFGTALMPMDNDPSDTFVRQMYINGSYAGNVQSGGGTVLGVLSLPMRWHPGLTVHVRWERCEPYAKNCVWHELDAPVHKYEKVGGTWLHIMPGDKEVLIIPSMIGPGHPDYPGPDFPTKDF